MGRKPVTLTQQHGTNAGNLGVNSVRYYSELNTVPKTWTFIEWTKPSVSVTDWLTPRPTGATYRPTNTTKTTHQHHHLDIQDTIHNVHTDAHSTPNTYFQHTIHTIYICVQLSNHGIASHTIHTIQRTQQSNLGNRRSPVTTEKLGI